MARIHGASADGRSAVAVWLVVPTTSPRALRHCPRCGKDQLFRSSGKFRVNAQKRRLDVWLVYLCEACDQVWNATVHERTTPEDLGAERLHAYHVNDPSTEADVAFDSALIARAGARLALPVPYRVEHGGTREAPTIRLSIPRPLGVRLDRLLATELGVSRSTLAAWFAEGRLCVEPASQRALRRPAVDGQLISRRS
jgi:hypothetical protein